MSAKDERAREILRGFKLYPPGSGAGPGGLGRWQLAEKGQGRGPRQVGTRGEAAGRKETESRVPDETRRWRRGRGPPEGGRGR